MTCKDCVHYEVCEDVFLKRRIEVGELQLCDCENFISKSILEQKDSMIAQLKSRLKSERLSKTKVADPYSAGVRDCAEVIKACEKVNIGHSLKVIIVAESEVDSIAEELIREKEYYSNFSKRNIEKEEKKDAEN